ncbi:hypothetical protein [Halioxenophilus sp. WMMB6]|uniref:hypothetical protein n=1 Tax=Halioxenophilus sp. WMMB6 TaxID=3073815 RepID=UPI00295F3130|nr:hypothetical protein [Halioxenophilus sp. WMMB6]
MKKLLLTLPALLLCACAGTSTQGAHDQLVEGTLENTPPDLLEYCKTTACRENTQFKLKMEDGSSYEYRGAIDPPIVQPDLITLYPGEDVFIEATIEGDRLVDMVVVPEVKSPEKTITMKFWQEPSMADGTDMLLQVDNPFEKFLRYELGMMTFDAEELQYTSSCPVIPGGSGFEHWPYPIFLMAFANLRLVEINDEEVTCE